jgi:hypothetical protein
MAQQHTRTIDKTLKNKIHNLYITSKIKDKQVAIKKKFNVRQKKCKFFHSFAFIKYVILESVKKR